MAKFTAKNQFFYYCEGERTDTQLWLAASDTILHI